MEKRESVDQHCRALEQLLAARPEVFARQGTVVASWRVRGGRRLGPYYRLAYRVDGKQQGLYLGSCPAFAAEVRQRLRALQAPRREWRASEQQRAALRAALRRQKHLWEAEVQRLGLSVQGYEVRGWRRLRAAGAPGAPKAQRGPNPQGDDHGRI